MVDHYHPKIIGITESWCSEDIQDAEIKLNDYSIYRGDRQSCKGGGVILYIHNSFHFLPCSGLNSLEINDSVWYTITLSNTDLLLVALVYLSPNSSFSNTDKLIQTLSNLQQLQRHTHLLLMGDFNFPNIDWCNHTTNTSDNSLSAQFYFATQDAYMIQHILKPTRHRKGQASSVVDLVFTLDPTMVADLEHLRTFLRL